MMREHRLEVADVFRTYEKDSADFCFELQGRHVPKKADGGVGRGPGGPPQAIDELRRQDTSGYARLSPDAGRVQTFARPLEF
jgi:hypothetical protein